MKSLKVYIAGKVSKDSVFGTHDWRDDVCQRLQKLSGRSLINLDPTKTEVDQANPELVFGADAYMIAKCDVLVAYLSDDISIGGSQEILIAKYYKKPVIGLAPWGGKFNGSTKTYFNRVVKDYRDPFVFSTCDVVCASIEEVGEALKAVESIKPRDLSLIDTLSKNFQKNSLKNSQYLYQLLD